MIETIEKDDRAPGQETALTSVIYATIALETFINEMSFLAGFLIERDAENTTRLRAFADMMAELEKGHESIEAKYLAGKFMISGTPFDKGKSPYQDFKDLVKLRNLIVHQKSFEEIKTDPSGNVRLEQRKQLETFRLRKLLGKIRLPDELCIDPDSIFRNWLDDISTRAMAMWACNTASSMVNSFLDGIPNGFFRQWTESAYRNDFMAPKSALLKPAKTNEGKQKGHP